eukprot:284815495_3
MYFTAVVKARLTSFGKRGRRIQTRIASSNSTQKFASNSVLPIGECCLADEINLFVLFSVSGQRKSCTARYKNCYLNNLNIIHLIGIKHCFRMTFWEISSDKRGSTLRILFCTQIPTVAWYWAVWQFLAVPNKGLLLGCSQGQRRVLSYALARATVAPGRTETQWPPRPRLSQPYLPPNIYMHSSIANSGWSAAGDPFSIEYPTVFVLCLLATGRDLTDSILKLAHPVSILQSIAFALQKRLSRPLRSLYPDSFCLGRDVFLLLL